MPIWGIVVIAILCAIFIPASVRIIREYERGVIFRLGRLVGAKVPASFSSSPSLTGW